MTFIFNKCNTHLSRLRWAFAFWFVLGSLQVYATPSPIPLPDKNVPLQAGSEFDYPPYCIVSKDSIADGFSVELLRASLKVMGYEVSFTVDNWNNIKNGLANGRFRVLPLVGRTSEREKVYDFTSPYLHMHGTIVVHADDTVIHTMTDLQEKRIAVMKGDNAEGFLRTNDLHATISTTTTFKEALQQLSEKKHDAVIIQKLLYHQLRKKHNFSNLKIVGPPLEDFVQHFCFAVRKGDSELLNLLDEGLAITKTDGSFNRLYTRWITPLTASHDLIIVGGNDNFPPFEFLDKNGKPTGYNVDLTRAIAYTMGFDVDIRLRPWSEIRSGLENGEIDIAAGMFYSRAKDLVFDFSPHHTTVTHVVVARKSMDNLNRLSLDSLAGKRVAISDGDIMHDIVLVDGLKKYLVPVKSQVQACSLVITGDCQYAIVARTAALYLIQTYGWNNLSVGTRSLYTAEYCFSVPHTKNVLLQTFNNGLKTLDENGEYRKIYDKWLAIYQERPFSILEIIRRSLFITLPITGILLILFLRLNRLKRTVNRQSAELRSELINRTRAEKTVYEERELFRVTLHSIAEAVITTDINGSITMMNSVAEKLCGWKLESATEHSLNNVFNIIDQYKREPFENPVTIALTSGTTVNHHRPVLLVNKKGIEIPITSSSAPIRDSNNTIIGAVLVFRDITEQEKMSETMQRTSKLNALGILAGGIAHDFNNLMGGVFGYIDMVCAMSRDETTVMYCTKAMSAIDRARSLTQQLLTFSKGGAPVKKVTNLFPFVEETVKFALSGSNISCSYRLSDNLPPCDFDRNQINQVINNIIINAQQAMPRGGTVTITAEPVLFSSENHLSLEHGNYVMLAFTDSGEGISEENIPRIFDPFFTTKDNAHGLGLSTSHSIITRHGGVIDVQSTPGEGSTFSIYLPAEQETQDYATDTTCVFFRGTGTFIVLEDEAIMRDIIIAMLKSFGFNVICATEGEETIRQYNEQIDAHNHVAGMIFDLTIPGGMGGRETIREIRKLSSEIPVFVASGYAADPVMAHPEEYGFTDSICKPFRKADLESMLLKHLS